jgi:hypothetical protein
MKNEIKESDNECTFPNVNTGYSTKLFSLLSNICQTTIPHDSFMLYTAS